MLSRLKANINLCIVAGAGPTRGGSAKRLPSGAKMRYPFRWMVYGMAIVHPRSTLGHSKLFKSLRWLLSKIHIVEWRMMYLNGLISRWGV